MCKLSTWHPLFSCPLIASVLFAICCHDAFLEAGEEEELQKRIYAHLLVADHHAAVEEASHALQRYPSSKALHLAYLSALSELGKETEAIEEWEETVLLFEEERHNRRVLENLAWGVLKQGSLSSQLNTRFNALLGAAFTHDARAIPLLLEQLGSSNALMRALAAKMSMSYPDAPVKEKIVELFHAEKVWYVRLGVIEAVGALRIVSLKSELKQILGSPRALAEEKMAATSALVAMYDQIAVEELHALVKSDRAALRRLALEIIAHLDLVDYIEYIIPLLKDSSSEVKVAALNALALLRVNAVKGIDLKELIEPHLRSVFPEVAISAAYALLLFNEQAGNPYLEAWLHSESGQWRRMASAAIRAAGKYGLALALKHIHTSQDCYVKMNLALSLIGQRVQVKTASDIIYNTLLTEKETLWMWDSPFNPLFLSLEPSQVKHIEQIPHYPVVVDQIVRLELLSILSILRYPHAQEAVRSFLQTHHWGVSGLAAATLLQEGDEEGLQAVRGLINDPDDTVRVQAALILASVGSDPAAVPVLQDAYAKVDREMKIHILEALGHIGDPHSIPFLLQVLKEPFQVLRVVAASALIQSLRH